MFSATRISRRRRSSAGRHQAAALFTTCAVLLGVIPGSVPVLSPEPALAGPDDNFSLTKDDNVNGEALIGEHVTYTLTASGSQASGSPLYNLSFRDVLPAGTSYVSASPAPTAILDDVPTSGETTLIWENVSDLQANSRAAISLTVDTNPDFAGGFSGATTVPVGSTILNQAEATASLDPFVIPDWDESTGAFTGEFDGSATASNSLAIVPFRVTKTGPDELLRGVHEAGFDGQSGTSGGGYTINVESNPDYPIAGLTLVDTLHPGLEFLGCSDYYPVDNTTVGDEWPGSGLVATGGGCAPTALETPESVDTAADGSTVVNWTLGDLTAGQTVSLAYRAGIPLYENRPFDATGPDAVSLNQGRNLDNNTGSSTGEPDSVASADPELLTAPEQSLVNTAAATGTYTPTGAVSTVSDATATEAEDLMIEKTISGSLLQGSTVVSTLTITASEYRDISGLVVRDLMPSALCFLGGYNVDTTSPSSDWNTNDCSGQGTVQSTINGVPVNAARVRELPDGGPYGTGRFELVWDFSDPSNAALANLSADGTITISYSSVVRSYYRGNLATLPAEPVLAGDRVVNRAEVSGADGVADVSLLPDPVDPDGGRDGDTAWADLDNVLPSIDKRIASKSGVLANGAGAGATSCADNYGSITWSEGDPAEDGYGPGDLVCFELSASFPAGVDYEGVTMQDVLPPGFEYIDGSATRVVGVDTMPSASVSSSSAGQVTFDLGGGTVDESGNEFRWTIATEVGDPSNSSNSDINANLLKFTHNNNEGVVFQLRDQAAASWTEPEVRLAKGVADVNDGTANGPDADGSLSGGSTSTEVRASDAVTFRVDVWNEGNSEALETEVWDVLPADFACADVSSISNGGTCSAGTIVWTGLVVPLGTTAGTGLRLTYDLTIPATTTAGDSWTNTAGVVGYRAETNQADPYFYYPESNIDSAHSADENTDAADDVAYIHTPSPEVSKEQTTGIVEAGNDEPTYVTIGELIRYDITVTIPEGTRVDNGTIIDTLPTGLVWHEGPGLFDGSVSNLVPTATSSTGSTALASGTVTHSGSDISYAFPTPYVNASGSGDDEVTITFYARASDVATNVARRISTRLRNWSYFLWDNANGNARPRVRSNYTDARIGEPNLEIVKAHTDPTGAAVLPGDSVTYRIDVTNSTVGVSFVSTGHDVTVVDTVPVGITPLGTGSAPVTSDGDTVVSAGVSPTGAFVGTWSETDRTITWTSTDWASGLDTLDPGVTTSFTYVASVDNPAVSSAELTNTADMSASSLDQNLTPTANPDASEARTYTDSDDDTVTLPLASIVKDIEPFNDADASDDLATATVGEPVQYQLTFTLPSNTIGYDTTAFDELPAELDFDSFDSVVVSPACEMLDPATGTTNGTSLTAADIVRLNPVGGVANRVAWFAGDVYANGDCEITVGYTAHVNSTSFAGDSVANDASLTWNAADQVPASPTSLPAGYNNPTSASWSASADAPAETFDVVEPGLRIDKDVTETDGSALLSPTCDSTPGNIGDSDGTAANGCDTEAGSTLEYTVTLEAMGTSPSHNITVLDRVPAGITPLSAPGASAVSSDGDTVTGPGGQVGVWSETDRTITWAVAGPLAVGSTETLDYHATIDSSDDLARNAKLTNSVTVPTYYALPAAERAQIVATNSANNDLIAYGNAAAATRGTVVTDSVTVEVHFPDLDVDKSAGAGQDSDDVRLDEPFTWVITVTNTDTAASAYDVDITDVLPEGWTYDLASASVETPYGTTQVDPACAADTGACAHASSLNTETLTWNNLVSGATEPLAPGEAITVTLTATPQSAALVSNATVGVAQTGPTNGHENSAVATAVDATGSPSCCDPDGPGGTAATSYTDSDTDEVFIARADLSVDKSITPLDNDTDTVNGPYWFGSYVNYTVEIANDGPDEATDVSVSDVLDPAALAFDSVVSASVGTFDSGTNTWTIGSLANGADATLVLRTRLVGIGTITNVAQASTSDQYDQDSTPGNNASGEDDHDSVTIEAVPTSLGDTVWFDTNGDGVHDPTEPGIPDVPVTITWADPGTGAAQSYSTTTSSTGSYGVPPSVGLPADTPITVTINSATTNLTGLSPSYDRDGTLDHTATNQITTADSALPSGALADLEFDFGYTPDGSQQIGDKVWWDTDNSGDATNGVSEPGIPDVGITATWAGWDGIFGNSDDLAYTTTTDASGNYLFSDVPAGRYRIVLDSGDLPSGLGIATYDVTGIATPHAADLTLAVSEERLDVDFSYRGAGSIGDTVWFDHDGDGTVDTDEPGMGGVTVTATWDGPNGSTNTSDDVVLTTVTAADGSYSFANLPDGSFTITVDASTLPGGLAPTADNDGIATPHTSVAVLASGARTNTVQDFGYRGAGSIGDTVFYDVDGVETDGVADTGDAVLPDVDVTVVWAGANGVIGDADDFSFTTTTDATGSYSVGNLPHGDYTVTVDLADLPDGIGLATYDADGTATAATSAATLNAASPSDLGLDFAFTGSQTNEIGDTVWLDLNGDGVQSGTEEVGISDVGVTLVWFGEDGILGTGDDVTQTTVTAADGTYLFDLLPDGDFTVTVDPATLPGGLSPVSDADGITTAHQSETTLSPAAASDMGQDFGYRGAGSIGDTIWFDIDASGDASQGTDEPGIGGVEVTLTWTNPQGDDSVQVATTAADGSYSFSYLPFGDYTVAVNTATLPGGMATSFDSDGTGTADTSTTSLDAANSDRDNQDFSYTGVGSLGDTVWFDQNNDGAADPAGSGVFDDQDQALEGIDIIVTFGGLDGALGDDPATPADESADDVVYNATTDSAGEWIVSNLPSGPYSVQVDASTLPAGINVATFDADGVNTVHVSVLALDALYPDRLDQDFSYTGAGSVGDSVWFDRDGDGVFDDDEVALGGVDVTLTYVGPDGTTVTLTETTLADGSFIFNDLPFGVDLTLTVDDTDLPEGFGPSHDADGIDTPHVSVTSLSAANPVDADQDFGYRGTGSIGDQIWLDRDGSGTATMDADDVALPSVEVLITWVNPTTGDDLSVTVATDASGQYQLDGLPFGDYTVTVVASTLPAGVEPTFDFDGITTAATSDITLDAGTPSSLDQDFSFAGTSTIGDTVWLDENGDGVIDAGEPLLEGAEVTIFGTDPITGVTFSETVTTDVDGLYRFDLLPAGEYTISVDLGSLPVGAAPTHDLDGTDTANAATLTLAGSETILDVDFGYRIEADLAIDKSHEGDFALGDTGTWTIEVTNLGDGPAVAPVTVTDELPAGVTYADASGDNWDCVIDDRTVTCVLVDDLGTPQPMVAGETASFEIDVTTQLGAVPAVTNSATVTSPTVDPNPENNTDIDPTAVPLAVLDVDKSLNGSLTPGQNAIYDIDVINQGPSVSNGTITLIDELPSSLTFVSANAGAAGATCSAVGQTVTCLHPASMAVGERWNVEITVRVATTATGQIINHAVVSGGNTVNGSEIPADVVEAVYTAVAEGETGTAGVLGIPSGTIDNDIETAGVSSVRRLAFTGSSTLNLLIWALLLTGIGSLLLAIAKRRRRISLPA